MSGMDGIKSPGKPEGFKSPGKPENFRSPGRAESKFATEAEGKDNGGHNNHHGKQAETKTNAMGELCN